MEAFVSYLDLNLYTFVNTQHSYNNLLFYINSNGHTHTVDLLMWGSLRLVPIKCSYYLKVQYYFNQVVILLM